MDRKELGSEIQALVGRCMSLETAARNLAETASVVDLEQARRLLVSAAQRLEPPPGGRSFRGSRQPKPKPRASKLLTASSSDLHGPATFVPHVITSARYLQLSDMPRSDPGARVRERR